MLVDIFIEMLFWVPAAGHTPKIEPVVPNLMSGLVGSSPLASAIRGWAMVSTAADVTKWRRLSMAFPCSWFLRQSYQEEGGVAIAPCSGKSASPRSALQHKAYHWGPAR